MQSKGVGNENHRGTTLGAMRRIDNRYGFIAVRGADIIYDTVTNTYYKQFRLPFKERDDA